jgi:hypothetical protein
MRKGIPSTNLDVLQKFVDLNIEGVSVFVSLCPGLADILKKSETQKKQ